MDKTNLRKQGDFFSYEDAEKLFDSYQELCHQYDLEEALEKSLYLNTHLHGFEIIVDWDPEDPDKSDKVDEIECELNDTFRVVV